MDGGNGLLMMGNKPVLVGLGKGANDEALLRAIGMFVIPFGVARGSEGNSLLCGVPRRDTKPSVLSAVPGVALPDIGANVLVLRALLIDGIAPVAELFHVGPFQVAGLNPGVRPDGNNTALGGRLTPWLVTAFCLGISTFNSRRSNFFRSAAEFCE